MEQSSAAQRREQRTGQTATLTLTMDMPTHSLAIGGEMPNIDTALAMLAQATRHFEGQARLLQSQQLMEQLNKDAETRRIAEMVRTKR